MKLQFTKEEFAVFEESLRNSGYIKTCQKLLNEDYYLYKTLIRKEGEAVCQMFFCVYDFSKHSSFTYLDCIHVSVEVHVFDSYEGFRLGVNSTWFNHIEEYENFATKFYQFTKEQ